MMPVKCLAPEDHHKHNLANIAMDKALSWVTPVYPDIDGKFKRLDKFIGPVPNFAPMQFGRAIECFKDTFERRYIAP